MLANRGDYVRGWWGVALVTDAGYGFTTDAATDEQVGPVDNLIRIKQKINGVAHYTYAYQEDVKEIVGKPA